MWNEHHHCGCNQGSPLYHHCGHNQVAPAYDMCNQWMWSDAGAENKGSNFVLIVVLFILLVIVGSVYR